MLNQRKSLSTWITTNIKRSSKRNQNLYEKFLKNETSLMIQPTKLIKVYLRQLIVSQKNRYSQEILQFKYDIKSDGLL